MSINRVFISGNITKDIELRATNSGEPVVNFTVVVDDRRKNPKTGKWEDRPNFISCTVFGRDAKAMAENLYQGAKVSIEGELRSNFWETEDGQTRVGLKVIVKNIEWL